MKKFIALFCFLFLGFLSHSFAFQNYAIDGSTYPFPDVDDQDWGQDVTDWAAAVTNAIAVSRSSEAAIVNGSTYTKTGGINLGGTLTATKLVGDGSGITNLGGFASTTATQTWSGQNTFLAQVKISTQENVGIFQNITNAPLSQPVSPSVVADDILRVNYSTSLAFRTSTYTVNALDFYTYIGTTTGGMTPDRAFNQDMLFTDYYYDANLSATVNKQVATIRTYLGNFENGIRFFLPFQQANKYIEFGTFKEGISSAPYNAFTSSQTIWRMGAVTKVPSANSDFAVLFTSVNAGVTDFFAENSNGIVTQLSGSPNTSLLSTTSICANLVITSGTTSTRLTITADQVNVMGFNFVNVSTTVDLAVSSTTGGLNVGGRSKQTWYALYFVANGSTIGVVASSGVSLNPSMPPIGNFTSWRRIGYVYTDAANNVSPYLKYGLNGDVIVIPSYPILTGVSAGSSFVSVDLSTFVPPLATNISFAENHAQDSTHFGVTFYKIPGIQENALGGQVFFGSNISGSGSPLVAGSISLALSSSRSFSYASAGGTVISLNAYLISYKEGGL